MFLHLVSCFCVVISGDIVQINKATGCICWIPGSESQANNHIRAPAAPSNTHNCGVCVYDYKPGKRRDLNGTILLQTNVESNSFKLVFIWQCSQGQNCTLFKGEFYVGHIAQEKISVISFQVKETTRHCEKVFSNMDFPPHGHVRSFYSPMLSTRGSQTTFWYQYQEIVGECAYRLHVGHFSCSCVCT